MISTLLFATLATNDKEAKARVNVEPKLKRFAKAAGLTYPPKQILFRVFKDEKTLEIWGGNSSQSGLKLIQKYPILAASGTLGPKLRYGDLQVPEGWYSSDRFNPNSSYHLSLGINYPTKVERNLARPNDPGGDIFIHGYQKSAGCLAMGDPAIEEIYTLAKLATNKVLVFILPSRTNPGPIYRGATNPRFYQQIYKVNSIFEKSHRIPQFTIDGGGVYRFK